MFLHDIAGRKRQACDVAKRACDEASSSYCIDGQESCETAQAMLEMQMIRDNLTLWTEADSQTMTLRQLMMTLTR